MKKIFSGIFLFCFLCFGLSGSVFAGEFPITACFTPRGQCTNLIVQELDHAQRSILVQAYSFTSAPIARALIDAHKRGVNVEAVLDKSNRSAKYSSATFLYNAGIPVKIDHEHAIAHNKIMVVDGETVITGSFNFTKSAQDRNAENLLVIHDRDMADLYIQNWKLHEGHSEAFTLNPEGWSGRSNKY